MFSPPRYETLQVFSTIRAYYEFRLLFANRNLMTCLLSHPRVPRASRQSAAVLLVAHTVANSTCFRALTTSLRMCAVAAGRGQGKAASAVSAARDFGG